MTRREETTLGIIGLIGAILVGFGECLLQFQTGADYTDLSYPYFQTIPANRIWWGHYIGILCAPAYLAGYGYLASLIHPAGKISARASFMIGSATFMIGAVWYGQRAFLALSVQAGTPELTAQFSSLNEPLVNVLRAAMVVITMIWARAVWSGQTTLPKWMAFFSPLTFLVIIFGIYFAMPKQGGLLLASAMNIAHALFFFMCLYFRRS